MNVLVVGSGGREHAIVWALKKSKNVENLYCAPGNAGIAADAKCVNIKVGQLDKMVEFAKENKIDLAVIGPEAPLCDGISDAFRAANIPVFGPVKEAALLEGSKEFAKNFMVRHNIPTAKAGAFSTAQEAISYVENEYKNGANGIVVKADGLAAGKGVLVAETFQEAKDFIESCFGGSFGNAGSRVVIEEKLDGEEASLLALVDGNVIRPLVTAQDHKRIWDDDKGLNTGGMGAYSPAPVVTDEVAKRIDEEILKPFLKGIQEENLDFRGVIFFGLMIDKNMPKVLEFNVRFGDPEIQPVLRRFEGDFLDVLYKTAQGRLAEANLVWSEDPAVSVVMASAGYPGDYPKGKVISGLEEAQKDGAVVFHAGTAFNENNEIVTDGGRVLGVSARGKDIAQAIENAYLAVEKISFEGAQYRKDIGRKALKRLEK
jgi:phosphoribosylamine--glycine ligase